MKGNRAQKKYKHASPQFEFPHNFKNYMEISSTNPVYLKHPKGPKVRGIYL